MKFLLLSISLLLSSVIFAQSECAVRIADSLEYQQMETAMLMAPKNLNATTCTDIRSVVHVIYDSNKLNPYYSGNIPVAQVLSQIRITNQFFRNDSSMYDPENTPLGYQLKLAEYDPEGNPTTGIVYHDGVALFGENWSDYGLQNVNPNAISPVTLSNTIGWGNDLDGNKYLNTYVVSSIDGNIGNGVQAYAFFPTGNTVYGNYCLFNTFGKKSMESEYDEIFALKPYTNQGLTHIHELLHNFAIYHTFQGNSCEPEDDPQWEGDRVADTPPQTQGYACDGACGVISNNVMDYLSQSCKSKITPGQVTRANLVINLHLLDYMVCNESPLCDKSTDLNGDGMVNILDISQFVPKWGCGAADPCFDAAFDLNCDGAINVIDLSMMINAFAANS